MKAVVHERYGPPDQVLKLRDIDIPALRDDEVLVRVLAHKPAGVTFEQAAATVAPGAIVLANLGPAGTFAAKNVMINGAGGAAGTLAVQVAKARGARVTGVDVAEKLAMIGQLGADHVIDFTREDPTRVGERYDLVFDVASTLSLDDCRRVLTPRGIYLNLGHTSYGMVGGRMLGTIPQMFRLLARSPFDDNLRKVNAFKMPSHREILTELQMLLETGKLTPIIARTFPLSDVPAAIQCLVEGRALGRIVVTP